MYNEREIHQAFDHLYQLFDEDTMEMLEENYSDEMEIPSELLAQAIRHNAMMVHEYRAVTTAGDCLDYCGNELFEQRATFILAYAETIAESETFRMAYRTELWLLEDMTFAVVRAVITDVSGDAYQCMTEYRTFVRTIQDKEDIFFEPEDLICELDDICTFFAAENEATIYEL